jgi:phenylacetate-CoA ligase
MTGIQKQIYDMLMESQFWPPETMLEYQRKQLASLLRHAKATVPFYKTRLDPVFRKNGEIDWDRWHEIPIVTRADLRDRRSEMLTTTLPPGHGPTKTFHSSGSSGVPISTEATALWVNANQAVARRFSQSQGLDGTKLRARTSNYKQNGDVLHAEFYLTQRDMPPTGGAHTSPELVLNRALAGSRKLELMKSEGAAYLVDFPNNTEILARLNMNRKRPVRLEAVLCYGQGVTEDQENLFLSSFGARSISVYSSEEGGMMACQCGDSRHYHLNAETVLVELLSPDGRVCGPGEPGRVVITPFFSTALPLIRYDQGDTAELQLSCTCSSRLQVLSNISGRQDQFLHFPEGIRSASGLNQKLLREDLNAIAFQLAQVETFKVEIRFVPDGTGKPVNAEAIASRIRQIVHPELEIVFKPVERIPLNSGGKQQRIVCEIAPQD